MRDQSRGLIVLGCTLNIFASPKLRPLNRYQCAGATAEINDCDRGREKGNQTALRNFDGFYHTASLFPLLKNCAEMFDCWPSVENYWSKNTRTYHERCDPCPLSDICLVAWENGYCESFNSKLRDELLNGEVFCTSRETRIVIESWRQHYNTVRPHSALGYRPPAPEAFISSRPAAQPQPAPPGAQSLASPPILN